MFVFPVWTETTNIKYNKIEINGSVNNINFPSMQQKRYLKEMMPLVNLYNDILICLCIHLLYFPIQFPFFYSVFHF